MRPAAVRAARHGDGGTRLVTVEPHSDEEVARIWRVAEHVLRPHEPRLAPHTLVVSDAALGELEAAGIATTDAIDGATARRQPPPPRAAGKLAMFDDWFSAVPDLPGVEAHLDELERVSGGRAAVETIGSSVEGRPIRALRLGPGPALGAPAILVLGTQHAREWASTMVALGLADGLARRAGVDPRVGWLLDHLEVIVVPVVNVDGYVATHQGHRLQRKNLHPGCGVDLNRNWDVAFGAGAPADGCAEENYPGTAPFSEPETRAVRDLAVSLGSRLRLFLDYHAPSEQVMIPLAFTRDPAPDHAKSRAWAELYADTLRSLYDTFHPARDAYDLAQGQGGGAIDWFRVGFCQSFSVELRDGRELGGFQLPSDQIIPSIEENWVAFLRLAEEVARDAGVAQPEPIVSRAQRAPLEAAGCSVGGTSGGSPVVLLLLALAAKRSGWRRACEPAARGWGGGGRGPLSERPPSGGQGS